MPHFNCLPIIQALPDITEAPHFEKTAFKIENRIFATLDNALHTLTVKLSVIDQDVFIVVGKGAVRAVPNKWGKQGWTVVNLQAINDDLLSDIIQTAYLYVKR